MKHKKTQLTKMTIAAAIMLLFFNGVISAQVSDTTSTNNYVSKNFYSKILNERRLIHIYTPPHAQNNGVYPVLYVLDGEAMMDMVTGQVSYLSESYKIIPSMIIVGIENTDRIRDLTPTHSIIGPDGKPDTSANAFGKNSGGGEKMLQFIQQELMPYINQNYPAAPYNMLFGHSLGGLMAVHSLVNHPGLFNAYIALSPSLQWDDQSLLKQVTGSNQTGKINGEFFFSDANESPAFHNNQLQLDSIFKQKNIPVLHFKYNYYPDETHISEPVKGFYDGIRYIYPSWYLNYNSSAFRKTMTAKMVKDQYESLSKKYNYNVIPLQDEVNLIARMFRRDNNKINDAIELLEMNAINYPASAPVFELLGDTYLKSGDKKKALTAYEKAEALDKNNMTIRQKIKGLGN
jgi:predicted alpha/beta superfamily hydrolase